MATTTYIPVETYLDGVYRPDVDYIDGRIERRNLGTTNHSKWQSAIQHWFLIHAEEWNVFVRPELRIHVSETRYRIADVTIVDAAVPEEPIPTHPPLIVFEVLSPRDRLSRIRERLSDFAAMGIPEIWLIDPATGTFDRFEDGQLLRREQFHLAEHGISFAMSEITKLVR